MASSFEPVRKYRRQRTVTNNPKSPGRFEGLRRRSAEAEAGGGPERQERFANPYVAAECGYIDTNPKKKHGNILL